MKVDEVIAPWLPWLRERTTATESALGPWLGRLARALGPAELRVVTDLAGDPTGWAGLTNRGPYDRLLASEWMLAEEVPDEFLRRAVSGEHLFVELERASLVGAPWTVILCDTGPDQLGPPRLVHLALLVALATRPDGPARVAVGSLQGDELWEPALARQTGVALARARTRERPRRADLDRWVERLADDPPELWVVGGRAATAAAAGRAHRAHVSEDWRTGALAVEVTRRDGRAARVDLGTAPDDAGPVLADPFDVRPARSKTHSALFVDATLYVQIHEPHATRLVRITVPHPDALLGRPGVAVRTLAAHTSAIEEATTVFVGACSHPGGVLSLWSEGRMLSLRGPARDRVMDRPRAFAVTRGAAPGPIAVDGKEVWATDGAGVLWHLDFDQNSAEAYLRTAGALAFAGDRALWWMPDARTLWDPMSGRRAPVIRPLTAVVNHQALVWDEARAEAATMSSDCVIAPFPLAPPAGSVHWFPYRGTLAVVEGAHLRLYGIGGPPYVWELRGSSSLGPEPVLAAAPAPNGGCLAIVTASGVRLYSPQNASLVASWKAE